MATALLIRAHIAALGDEQIFTTREFFLFGSRGSIDTTLCRMVKAGEIFRLAYGVFVKGSRWPDKISLFDVVKAKAAAFERSIHIHGKDGLNQLQKIQKALPAPCSQMQWELKEMRKAEQSIEPTRQCHQSPTKVFYTSGCSSIFHVRGWSVRLVSTSKKRCAIPDSTVGIFIKAIWYLGISDYRQVRAHARYLLNTRELEERIAFRTIVKLAPQWLREMFFW
ncbi:MAG TPA: hypothetical protein PKC98_00680 [Candidatus Melainabacteria bacterium]|nr:hypothetical protein [Candidatus Melainabacteria bacterium]